jgi:hypothetical protein
MRELAEVQYGEPAWYYPDMLYGFRLENPTPPGDTWVRPDSPVGKLDWLDGTKKNAAWISRFQDYVAARDPGICSARAASA